MNSFMAVAGTVVLTTAALGLLATAPLILRAPPVENRAAASPRSNVLGATGLSRHALAAMFRRDGLFGRESRLTLAEQAVVQAALPRVPGLKPCAVATYNTPHLLALADYVSTLVAEGSAEGERARLEKVGLSSAAINEAATIVDNVLVVFRPRRWPAVTARPAQLATLYDRAA